MSSGFEEMAPGEEPKDRTKWIWLGVILLLAAMLIVMRVAGRQELRGMSVARCKHILIQFKAGDPAERAAALKRVTEIRERLLKGEDFGKLARDYSDDTSSNARGGDLAYNKKGLFLPAFEEYVWSAPIGQLSEPIITTYGFHLIVVLDRHVAEGDLYEEELKKRAKESESAPKAATP